MVNKGVESVKTGVIVVVLALVIGVWFRFNVTYPTVVIGDTKIFVELAQTQAEKELGLSNRPGLEQDEGMLFINDRPGFYTFWMKDMKFDLDIIWIDHTGRVVHIEEYVSPYDYPETYVSDEPAQYILEVNGGISDDADLEVGDYVEFVGIY